MPRAPAMIPDAWPVLMDAATAAAYCGERSVDAFRRRVGSDYPAAHKLRGRGQVWRRDEIDQAIDKLTGRIRPGSVPSASDVL